MDPAIPREGSTVEDLTLALSEAKEFHQTKELILKESCSIAEAQLMKAREEIEELHQDTARFEKTDMDGSMLCSDLAKENDILKQELKLEQYRFRAAQQELKLVQDQLRTAQQEIETLQKQKASSENAKNEALRAVEKQFVGEMVGIKENVENTVKQLQESKDDILRQITKFSAKVKPGGTTQPGPTIDGVDKLGFLADLRNLKENILKAEKDLRTAQLEIARLRAHASKRGIQHPKPSDPERSRSKIEVSRELEITRQSLKEALHEIGAKTTGPNPTKPAPDTKSVPNTKSVPPWRGNPPPTSDEILAKDFRGIIRIIKEIANSGWYLYEDGPKPSTKHATRTNINIPIFHHGDYWASLQIKDRKLRVRARFFELIHEKILSENSFGVIGFIQQADIETILWRAQNFFTKRNLNPQSLKKWKSLTSTSLDQRRSTEEHINISANEIFHYLKPLQSPRLRPSDETELMSAIMELCNEAYDVRLRMYQTPGTFTCKMLDPERPPLLSYNMSWVNWTAVEGGMDGEGGDVIVYVLSGALVKYERGNDSEVVLEKARVVLEKGGERGVGALGW